MTEGSWNWRAISRISSIIFAILLPLFVDAVSGLFPPVSGQEGTVTDLVHANGRLISDSQFVYAREDTHWDIETALREMESPLSEYAGLIEIYALMSSIDPRVLMTIMEIEYALVRPSDNQTPLEREMVTSAVEEISQRLYHAYYSSLPVALDSSIHAGSLAIVETLGWEGADRFPATVKSLFPDFDPLADDRSVIPTSPPPTDMLQFPYPLGEAWQFNGTHGWSGNSQPFSSIDFSPSWPQCGGTYNAVVVAAGSGLLRKPRIYADCWLEIDHPGGWTTSYYHLTNVLRDSGPIEANTPLGYEGCEICVGGFANAAHVHFSLKYNGAYVSLEGVTLSGWRIYHGSKAYSLDTHLIRGDLIRFPYSTLLNDGGQCSLIGTPILFQPVPNALLPGRQITFQWDPPSGEPAPSSYLIRIRDRYEMTESSGTTFWEQRVPSLSSMISLPAGCENRTLFWSVQAWRLGACSPWAEPHRFSIGELPADLPIRLSLPLHIKVATDWPAPTPTVTVTPS